MPEERLVLVDMRMEGNPFVGLLNYGLAGFAHRDVFGWFLSVIIEFERTVGEGMPDDDDTRLMQVFSDSLTEGLSGEPEHPNVLFLGRVTGDGATEIMWYVNDPEAADGFLRGLIESKEYAFDFDYEMRGDPEWREASYWLQNDAAE